MPGSIVSNTGFINQIGAVKSDTGALSLNAQYLSVWSAVVSATRARGVPAAAASDLEPG